MFKNEGEKPKKGLVRKSTKNSDDSVRKYKGDYLISL